MSKKLTIKERDEVVTKGYLHDTLEEKQYVTKDYLQQQFAVQADEIERRIEAIMEHQMHLLHVFWEGMDERYVLRKEWLAQTHS